MRAHNRIYKKAASTNESNNYTHKTAESANESK